jgi:hypothetical protein
MTALRYTPPGRGVLAIKKTSNVAVDLAASITRDIFSLEQEFGHLLAPKGLSPMPMGSWGGSTLRPSAPSDDGPLQSAHRHGPPYPSVPMPPSGNPYAPTSYGPPPYGPPPYWHGYGGYPRHGEESRYVTKEEVDRAAKTASEEAPKT